MESETETDDEMEMEEEEEPLVFEVSEIEMEYEFDAAQWYDFTREELESESRVAQLWFRSAQSYPPSPFAIKLLMMEEVSDDKTETLSKSDVNETGNGTGSGVFNFIPAATLEKVPNQSLHYKGPRLSNHRHSDKMKPRSKSSTRPIPRSSTLLKPTVSQLARQENTKIHVQVKENGLSHSTISEAAQDTKRQKLDGGRLRKVAEKKQDMNFVHKTPKKDGTLDRNTHHAKTKITIPHEPHFATSHRARIRHKDDAKLDQASTSVYRFKARPFNRKIFEAPSLPIRKKSTPKLPEFREFHLKTSERAMQHSSVVSTVSYQGNNFQKGANKPDTTAILDGVNREPRRSRATDRPKYDDRKDTFKARPLNNKLLSVRGDTGIIRKSKRETTVALAQTQESGFDSEKRVQTDLPTELFSKLSLTSEPQQNNGSRLRMPQHEQVKGSKDNKINSFQAGNERRSKGMGKPLAERDIGMGKEVTYKQRCN